MRLDTAAATFPVDSLIELSRSCCTDGNQSLKDLSHGASMKRQLAAIVAADMAGYSRLMEQDEEGVLSRQKLHRRELIDPEIDERGGRIVKTTGDGVLVEFASAQEAVRCALNIQREMVRREADTPANTGSLR